MPALHTVEDRLRALLSVKTPERGRFRVLADRSGLTDTNWKNFWYERQRPNPEMLEFACKEWPQFCLWLMTGETFAQIGQVRPDLDQFKSTLIQETWAGKYIGAKLAARRLCATSQAAPDDNWPLEQMPEELRNSLELTRTMALQEIRSFLDNPALLKGEDWNTDPADGAPDDDDGLKHLPQFKGK